MIRIDHLNYEKNHKAILKDISFEFEEGKTYGIIGPNGAGKSTLLKHLMNLIVPPKHTIFYKDEDIRNFQVKEYAKKVSFVFQENTRQLDFSVYEILLMGKYTEMDIWGNLPKEIEQEVYDILQELQIEHLKDQPIHTLSGGEAQKVFIGRALLQNTPVLLLDEPTSMLDMHNSIELLRCVEKLRISRGLTIIMVLHDLNLALQSCEKLLLMEKGEMILSGTPDQIVKSMELQRVYSHKLHFIEEAGQSYIVPRLF